MKKNKYKILLGDCLRQLRFVKSGSVDLVLADLPYGTTQCKWDSIIPMDALSVELNRVAKENAAMVFFGAEPFSTILRMSNLSNFRYDWVWDKKLPSGMAFARFQPMRQHEIVSVFYRKTARYFPQMMTRRKPQTLSGSKTFVATELVGKGLDSKPTKTYTQKFPISILTYQKCTSTGTVHPTQKPLQLLEYLIKTYTNEGDTVLDPTMGSGSTGVACYRQSRNFIGIEKDEKYFKIAKCRIDSADFNFTTDGADART